MTIVNLAALLLSLAIPALSVAQPPEGDRPEGRSQPGRFGGGQGNPEGRPRFPNPLMTALDTDKDGELSAEEIQNASAALKSLDKNSDGKLDVAETRPNFDGMGRGGFGGGGNTGGFQEMVDRLVAMDANKNGNLEKDELPERMQSLFARGDKNSDGALDKEEMTAIAKERFGGAGGTGREFLSQLIERADADKDGKLSDDEIPPFMRERLDRIDSNKDGALDKSELEAMAARMQEGRGQGRGASQRPPVETDDQKTDNEKDNEKKDE